MTADICNNRIYVKCYYSSAFTANPVINQERKCYYASTSTAKALYY